MIEHRKASAGTIVLVTDSPLRSSAGVIAKYVSDWFAPVCRQIMTGVRCFVRERRLSCTALLADAEGGKDASEYIIW